MSGDKRLDFVRVLIAAAWADGDITCEEMNQLKGYFRELELTEEELSSLEIYFADPIATDEAETIIGDYLEQARRGERETLVAAIRGLLATDGKLEPGEKAFLELLQRSGEEMSTAAVFVSRLKRLWGAPRKERETAFRRSDLIDVFVRNRVYYQIKRRLLSELGGVELDPATERELRYVCALGALLAHVAGADQAFDERERAAIARILDDISDLHPRDLEILSEIVASDVLSDVSYFEFARELNELADREERVRIVEMLFDVAAADGEISHAENEEIRKIAKVLQVEHARFIAAKAEREPQS